GWLVILLLGFAFFFLAGIPASTTASVQVLPAEPAGRPARPAVVDPRHNGQLPERANAEYFAVERVDVTVRGSASPQVSVNVSGYWSNGCSAEPHIDMAVEGSTVIIGISRTIPPDVMCT